MSVVPPFPTWVVVLLNGGHPRPDGAVVQPEDLDADGVGLCLHQPHLAARGRQGAVVAAGAGAEKKEGFVKAELKLTFFEMGKVHCSS